MAYKDRDYFQEWRQQTIEYLGGKCALCDCIEDLEFDHINEKEKEFGISTHWSMKDKNKLQKEIDKCQLLCNKHHKEKTKEFLKEIGLQQGITHGTYYSFGRKNCKCDSCNKARQEWYRKRNARRRIQDNPRQPYIKNPLCGDIKKYYRGCRCDLCRAANAAKARRLKEKVKNAGLVELAYTPSLRVGEEQSL